MLTETSRKAAGDDSRNPHMHAACSALGMLGDSQPETSPQVCREVESMLQDSPKAFRDPAQDVSLETLILKNQVTQMGNCQETNK